MFSLSAYPFTEAFRIRLRPKGLQRQGQSVQTPRDTNVAVSQRKLQDTLGIATAVDSD